MKKLLLIGAIALSGASMVNAQKIGAKAGLNFASIGGDKEFTQGLDGKIGFHVGIYGEWAIAEKFSIQPEVLYSAQGAKGKEDGVTLKMNLDYINIPVMFKYKATDKFSLEAGPQVGFLINSKAKVEAGEQEASVDLKDGFKKIDFAIGLGAGYDITEKFNVGVRYMAGVSNILESKYWGADNLKANNNVFSLSLGYRFK